MIFDTLYFALLFLLGISIGSFINVLVDRYDKVFTVFTSVSRCEKCRKKIAPWDLIPILSFLILRGKCRHCEVKITKRILIVELTVGVLFIVAGAFVNFESIYIGILVFLILSVLMALFFVDYEHGILPDYLLAILFLVSIFVNLQIGIVGIGVLIGIGLIFFVLFLLLFVVTRGRGIGFGDVKFSFVIGVLLGFPNGAVALYLSFVLGALVSLVLVAMGRKKLRGDTIPFGPFMVSGTIIMLLFSERVYSLLFSIFR